MEDQKGTPFKPPYMSFQTFWKFIEDLSARPLPPRIDRSIMASKSGTDQANLMGALTAFRLIQPENMVVENALRELTDSDEGKRLERLAALIREFYPEPMAVSEQNGTEGQLNEAFKGSYGLDAVETRRKAVTFFLHGARTAGLPLSPHFPATRSGSGSPGASRPKKATKRKVTPPAEDTPAAGAAAPTPKTTQGSTYTVSLASGGEVSVVVEVDLFGMTTEDRTFVIELVDKLKGYPRVENGTTKGGDS